MQKYGYQCSTSRTPYNNSNLLAYKKGISEYNDKRLPKNINQEIKKRSFISNKTLSKTLRNNNSYNSNTESKTLKKNHRSYISIDKLLSNNTKSLKKNYDLLLNLTKEFSSKLNQITDRSNHNDCNNELKTLMNRLIHLLSNSNSKKTLNSKDSFFNELDGNCQPNISQNFSEEENKTIESLISKYEQKISLLSKENNIIMKKLNSSNYNNNYEELISQIKNLENENKKLKNDNKELEIKLTNSNNIINELNEKISELENNNKELGNKLTDSNNINNELKGKISELENNNKELENKLTDSNNINNELKGKISELENNNEKNKASKKNNSTVYVRDVIYQNQINKINDLKTNLDEVISQKKIMDNNIGNYNITTETSGDKTETKKKIIIRNTPKFKNSYSCTKPAEIKKEIDVLDEEIGQIELKLKQMLQE